MIPNWADRAGLAAFALVCGAICYAALRRTLLRAAVERQQTADRKLEKLTATVRALEAKVAELNKASELRAEIAPEFEMTGTLEAAVEPSPALAGQPVSNAEEEVTPETMAVLAAAVTAFLGRKVRVLSAKRLESPRLGMSPWSQQGRVFVQASHNLRVRG